MTNHPSHLPQYKIDRERAPVHRNIPEDAGTEMHPLLRLQQKVGNAQIARLADDDELYQGLPEVGLAGGPVSNRLANRITSQLGKGSPLPPHKREEMESHFGQPLNDVRVHTGTEADGLNRSISARAFTLGSDVFLRNGVSPHDDQLLNHELTHVVQQRTMPFGGPLTVGPTDDPFEKQAQAASHKAPSPGSFSVPDTAYQTGAVQRDFGDELNLGNLSGIAGLGLSGIQTIAELANNPLAKMMETTGGAITDASALGPLGGLASIAGLVTGTQDMLNEDKPWYERVVGGMSAAGGATGTAGSLATLFGSTAFTAGGTGGLTAGLGTAFLGSGLTASLASGGAVLGAGAAGYGAGRLLDEGVGALGQWINDDDQGDYTISGGIADRMTDLDRTVSGVFADPDEPAYTQTLGWQLAEWLD